jgi:hypothetical protein
VSYRYYEGTTDKRRQFCVATSPTFVCGYTDGFEAAAGIMAVDGISGERLSEIVANAHARTLHSSLRLRDADGKLTDECRVCGAKLIRKGFAAWEQREREEQTGIAMRLGIEQFDKVGEKRYFRTKKQAWAWARKASGRA